MDLDRLVRPNILNLKPYSSARDEFKGTASVYLDANESPYNSPFNRYPDPLQTAVKEKIAEIKNVETQQIFLGNGSDEPIDLLFRVFCEPTVDNVVSIYPTYGMYEVAAGINNVEYRKFLLDEKFSFSAGELIESAVDDRTKMIFLCSPNNPTGNNLNKGEMQSAVELFEGIVVVDEAYIDFSLQTSMLEDLAVYENLVVLQTFSKAWGNAAIRLGMAFANPKIVSLLNKVKYPYNINVLTHDHALKMLENEDGISKWVMTTLRERELMIYKLSQLKCVKKIYHSDANFLLVKVSDANALYNHLVENGVIVRNRNKVTLCDDCLRITVGTTAENEYLLGALKTF